MALVDVVVVSYRSRARLAACVAPLADVPELHVVVVDNASDDGSLDAVGDLPLTALPLDSNGGFARGCNAGWRVGSAPVVLFLNPDATIRPECVLRLAHVLDDERVGVAGPRIVGDDGELHWSQRRFPRLASLYAQALFLHRLLPRAAWTDELVRRPELYERAGSPEWLSGACLALRRTDLERLGGLDEGFFLYCEDTDLCRRVRDLGLDVRYEPSALATHAGGASAPRDGLLPVLAASRLRYARKHCGRVSAALARPGIALGALARLPSPARRGHVRTLRFVLGSAS